jgi:hypothetical protein
MSSPVALYKINLIQAVWTVFFRQNTDEASGVGGGQER